MSFPIFLRAEWRDLAILNFEAAPSVLEALVPPGLELDPWKGRHYVSLVGFRFLNSRVFGVPMLLHRDFDEVNLRFYVRRRAPEGWRHGVVFIRELVARRAVAFAARTLYNEPYVALRMRHRSVSTQRDGTQVRTWTYAWTFQGRDNSLSLSTETTTSPTREGSEEAFFVERRWGYSVQRDGCVLEYHVERPCWLVAAASEARLTCDVAALYGERFVKSLVAQPASSFFASGSEVTLSKGVRLPEKQRA